MFNKFSILFYKISTILSPLMRSTFAISRIVLKPNDAMHNVPNSSDCSGYNSILLLDLEWLIPPVRCLLRCDYPTVGEFARSQLGSR